MTAHEPPEPMGWSTAVGEVGLHKINVRGYKLSSIIENLTFSEAVFLTIRGELPTKAQSRVLDAVLCGILEHGFFAPTTVAARLIASAAPQTIIPGVAGGLLTVGAVTVSPQDSAELIPYAYKRMEDHNLTKEETARQVAEEMLSKRQRMPGIGHPLHPTGDPRAISLKKVAVENDIWSEKSELYEAIRDEFVAAAGKQLPINIDGMMGCVLTELGFIPREMPGIAAISFMPGIIAHAVEEVSARTGLRTVNGTYTGVAERELPPDFQRSQ